MPPNSAASGLQARDAVLDMAKGLAILLVVLGHTLQGMSPQFEDLPAFRVIYAFHMPLFAFLAGAAATHWLRRIDQAGPLRARVGEAWGRVRRSSLHLLLPFATWTLIGWAIARATTPLPEYLLRVLRQPDVSLWFLPAMFWCTVFASAFVLLSGAVVRWLAARFPARMGGRGAAALVQLVVFLLLWHFLKRKLTPAFGLVFANEFHGGLFLFFALGVAFFGPFTQLRSKALRVLPYLLFAALVPYWHRTLPHNLLPDAPVWLQQPALASKYALVIAVCGTLAAVDLVRVLAQLPLRWVHAAVAYAGQASLAVYAVHFYFLGIAPAVVAPMVLSVAFYALASRLPVIRLLLLGTTTRPQSATGPRPIGGARDVPAVQRSGGASH